MSLDPLIISRFPDRDATRHHRRSARPGTLRRYPLGPCEASSECAATAAVPPLRGYRRTSAPRRPSTRRESANSPAVAEERRRAPTGPRPSRRSVPRIVSVP